MPLLASRERMVWEACPALSCSPSVSAIVTISISRHNSLARASERCVRTAAFPRPGHPHAQNSMFRAIALELKSSLERLERSPSYLLSEAIKALIDKKFEERGCRILPFGETQEDIGT